jgi:hypothetical protein
MIDDDLDLLMYTLVKLVTRVTLDRISHIIAPKPIKSNTVVLALLQQELLPCVAKSALFLKRAVETTYVPSLCIFQMRQELCLFID